MEESEKALATVSVEEVLPEQLEGINVIAKVDVDSSGIGFLAKADSVLQAGSNVLEMIPQKGLFKVEVPEGFTLQDLVQVKGENGAFRGVVKGSNGKMAGQAKLTQAGGISPTQIAGAGLAAAAMVVGQAYMTEISDSLHSIDEKLSKVVSMIADEQKARLMNALDIAKRIQGSMTTTDRSLMRCARHATKLNVATTMSGRLSIGPLCSWAPLKGRLGMRKQARKSFSR